jgi:hypothetical protein
MDFNATIDLIIRDLDEARDIIDDLKKYPGVPVLQVELAKSKCKSAGEVIALLKTIKNNSIRQEIADTTEPEPSSQEVPLKKVTAGMKPEARSIKPEAQELKPEVTDTKPASQVQKTDTENSNELITLDEPDKHVRKPDEPVILADTFSHMAGTLNEQLGYRKADDDIADLLKTKPLSSLTEAIGINDRFFFIREIFKNDKDSFSLAISRLDSAESLSDARAIIMSYTGDNNENEAVKQLLDLVKRKLPSNE